MSPFYKSTRALLSSVNCPHNWNETETKQFQNCLFQPKQNARPWNVSAVLATKTPQTAYADSGLHTLFERQTRGGDHDVCVNRRSLRWMVARYCNALIFGVTTRVTRYILPKVTPSVTIFIPFTETSNTYDLRVCWVKFDWQHHWQQFCINSGYRLLIGWNN